MVSKPMVEDTLLRDMPEFSTSLLQEQPAGCLAGVVSLFLVERQVTAVDARQPFDQALREPVG
jgi:hypothetical protein